MKFRSYQASDYESCMNIFDSNCPHYFDASEREAFNQWLQIQGDRNEKSPLKAYPNTDLETYSVLVDENLNVVACCGYFMFNRNTEARFAWGMVHIDFHHKGIGTFFTKERIKDIKTHFPNAKITLATSQHTFEFYKHMGFETTEMIPNGFGVLLHKYEMELQQK